MFLSGPNRNIENLAQPTSCLCDRDWAGLECKEYLRCNSYCQNGGTCYYDEASKAPKCLCTMNFEGETCEMRKKSIFQNSIKYLLYKCFKKFSRNVYM